MVDANSVIVLERACNELDPSWMVRREDLDSDGSKGYSADMGDGWETAACPSRWRPAGTEPCCGGWNSNDISERIPTACRAYAPATRSR